MITPWCAIHQEVDDKETWRFGKMGGEMDDGFVDALQGPVKRLSVGGGGECMKKMHYQVI